VTAISMSTQDLKKQVLRHCGEVEDGTSTYDVSGQVMDYLNRAYVAILSGGNEFDIELSKPWTWAVVQNPWVQILKPTFTGTGTVTATNGSKTVSFSVAPTISLTNYLLKIDGLPDFMRVVSHAGGSITATLDAVYASDTVTTSYTAVLIDYKLKPNTNGILRLTQSFNTYQPQDLLSNDEQRIYFMDEQEMAKEYPVARIREGAPGFFSIQKKEPDGSIWVRLNKSPSVQTRMEFKGIEIPDPLIDSATSFPLIPVEHRDCLSKAASYYLLLDKNDQRFQMFLQLTQSKLKAMQKAEEKQKTQTSSTRGKLIPRRDIWQRGKRYIQQETS